MREQIQPIAYDLTIKTNLVKAATMALLYPLLKDELRYNQSFTRYKEAISMPLRFDRLEQRVSNLEARNTLLEADLTLLRAQLDCEYAPNTS